MTKRDELDKPNSCLNKARLFILLARDKAAPAAIRAWAKERVRLGLNQEGDAQLTEALECADRMSLERTRLHDEH